MGLLKRVLVTLCLLLCIFAGIAVQATPTTYMNMTLPDPGTTAGPTWAQQLNSALQAVDSHDHSAGKGTKVTPSGLNISADLEFNGNDATELRTSTYNSQSGTLSSSDTNAIYSNGGNLYWNNGSGGAVQITSGSAVVSSISGAFASTTPGAYPYTVSAGDAQKVLLVDTSTTRTINLPAATTAILFMVKDKTGSSQTNNITVARAGSDTIDGAASSKTLALNSGWWVFISDGVSNWVSGGMPQSPGTMSTQSAAAVAITGGTIAGATITGGSITGMTDIAVADGGTGASTAAGARTNLGLVIGTNVAAAGANSDIQSLNDIETLFSDSTHDIIIKTGTGNGSDTHAIALYSGQLDATGRGAKLALHGTDHGVLPGVALLQGDGGVCKLNTQSANNIVFSVNNLDRWGIETDGDLAQDPTNGGNMVFTKAGSGVTHVVATGVEATGSDLATAAATTYRYNRITSGAAGTGMAAPTTIPVGGSVFYMNDTSTDKTIYAQGSQTFENFANPSITVSAGNELELIGLSSTQWWLRPR